MLAQINQTRASDIDVNIGSGESKAIVGAASEESSLVIRNSNIIRYVRVSSDGPVVVKSSKVTINYPDVCKVPAPPAPIVPPCGSINVSSGASVSADFNHTIASDVVVKVHNLKDGLGSTSGVRPSSVTIRNSRLRHDVNVSADVPLSVNINRTKVMGDVFIETFGAPIASDIRVPEFTNSIHIVDSVLGSLDVTGSDSQDALRLVRLRVMGKTQIDAGGGNDSLQVADSLFAGFALLDGGDGSDSLTLRRTRFRSGSKVVNWE